MSRGQHLVAPPAMRNVEKQGAGGIGHIDRMLSGKAQSDVILGKKKSAETFPQSGFMIADPKQLGEGEVRQRRIAGEFDQPSAPDRRVQLLTFFGSPLSHQISAGRSTWLSLSSSTAPCICPENPIQAISLGVTPA